MADGSTGPAVADLVALGRGSGLDAVGVAPARRFDSTLADLNERKAEGLHGGMNFTYRKPERSTDPDQTLPGARALVVGARSYLASDPPPPAGRPQGRVARYAWRDHYAALREGLGAIADELGAHGWRARVVADDNALVDREAARRAGLGWYGKNANLLLPGAGSWFVLGSVITDAPLPATREEDRPADGCGTCTRCLDGCPTGAIVAPGVVDARRCLAWLLQDTGPFPREYRAALGDRMYGCDDCQEVCPPNRLTRRRQETSSGDPLAGEPADAGAAAGNEGSGEPEAWVDLLELFDLDDAAALARYGRWYIPRREARYLRRNALVVLGNVADPSDGRVVTVLRRSLADGDPLVRSHAIWAARRLGHDDLITGTPGLVDDADPLVQAELSVPGSLS